jgi:hypothetical protein
LSVVVAVDTKQQGAAATQTAAAEGGR